MDVALAGLSDELGTTGLRAGCSRPIWHDWLVWGRQSQTGRVRKQYHFWPGEQGIDAWDVDRLIELTAGFGVVDVPLSEIWEVDTVYWFDEQHRPTVRSVIEHARLIEAVDREHPIILGPDGRVMDGMHRVARALLEGDETIAAVRFGELPEATFRNCDPNELPYD